MKIKQIMSTVVATVQPETGFKTLLCKHRGLTSRLLYVVDQDNRLKGIISRYDLLKVMAPGYLDANLVKALGDDQFITARALDDNLNKTALDVMIKDLKVIHPEDHLIEAIILIRDEGINEIPVVDHDGKLVGQVSRRDVLVCLMDQCGLDCGSED